MTTKTNQVSTTWRGLTARADVYKGSTPSSGPDPSSIEDISLFVVKGSTELELPADVVDMLCDEPSLHEALWNAADSDDDEQDCAREDD